MRKIVLLLVFNRPEKTKQTLENLRLVDGIDDYELIVVRQEGSAEVKLLVEQIDWIKTYHYVTCYSPEITIKSKINNNMRYGLSIAFDEYKTDFVVVIEDDLLIGYDFLVFCEFIQGKYWHNPMFRAINAFSREPYDADRLAWYGRFHFGVGKGWSINKKVWNKLRKFWHEGVDEHFDVLIEPWIRKGFVVMPYCSRSVDIGWGGGSHTPENENDPYYEAMKSSWTNIKPFQIRKYLLRKKMPYSWREDCTSYDFLHFVYQLSKKITQEFLAESKRKIKQIWWRKS
ncbi:MAG: hypothetical protein KF713_08590 [Turneriella sp.]|nr:hypothetical protein [Turneriella sp.]